jgi:hypothetical protein
MRYVTGLSRRDVERPDSADHGGTMDDVNATTWRKSTRSGGNGGDCVEVAEVDRDADQ